MNTQLQRLIDAAAAASRLRLPAGEIEGPGQITKPLHLVGSGTTLWTRSGPVLRISSNGVSLEDLDIQVTQQATDAGLQSCVIETLCDVAPQVKNVILRGNVHGLAGEEGHWVYPNSLKLGQIRANKVNRFKFEIECPVPCTLESSIDGLSIAPSQFARAELQQVEIVLDPLRVETVLRGDLLLRTPLFLRVIRLSARAVTASSSARIKAGDGEILFALPKASNPSKTEPPTPQDQTESSSDQAATEPNGHHSPSPPNGPPRRRRSLKPQDNMPDQDLWRVSPPVQRSSPTQSTNNKETEQTTEQVGDTSSKQRKSQRRRSAPVDLPNVWKGKE